MATTVGSTVAVKEGRVVGIVDWEQPEIGKRLVIFALSNEGETFRLAQRSRNGRFEILKGTLDEVLSSREAFEGRIFRRLFLLENPQPEAIYLIGLRGCTIEYMSTKPIRLPYWALEDTGHEQDHRYPSDPFQEILGQIAMGSFPA